MSLDVQSVLQIARSDVRRMSHISKQSVGVLHFGSIFLPTVLSSNMFKHTKPQTFRLSERSYWYG